MWSECEVNVKVKGFSLSSWSCWFFLPLASSVLQQPKIGGAQYYLDEQKKPSKGICTSLFFTLSIHTDMYVCMYRHACWRTFIIRMRELGMHKKVSNALFCSSTFYSDLAPLPSTLNANETSSLDIIGHGPGIDGFWFAAGQARACAFVPEWKQVSNPVLSPCSSPHVSVHWYRVCFIFCSIQRFEYS